MPMKVTKLEIHRLSVDMSCGCKMYAEFTDAQCRTPLTPTTDSEESAEPKKVFLSCEKHKTQDVIEFIIGERLEEAITDAYVAPLAPKHLHPLPHHIEEGDSGGVVASASNVQSVLKVNRPNAVGQEPVIKTLQRSREQLAKVGAATLHSPTESAGDIQIDSVSENKQVTQLAENVLWGDEEGEEEE